MIVAAPVMNGWFRGVVVQVHDNNECDIKFVDYGGYSRLPTALLRQIRVDFMTLPFQAAECLLADIKPTSGALITLSALLDIRTWIFFNRRWLES